MILEYFFSALTYKDISMMEDCEIDRLFAVFKIVFDF